MAVKENITSYLFLSSLSYSNVYIHSSDKPYFMQNDKLKGCEKQDCTIGFTAINPFAPGDFAEKCVFDGSQAVFWSLSCYKREIKIHVYPKQQT